MKKIAIQIIVLLLVINCQSKKMTNVSVMTYNVRYGLADDGENSWEFRKGNLAKLIQSYNPDFLGTQEGLPFQVNYIQSKLPNHAFIGKSREGNGKGEYSAIFYNKDKFIENKQHTFWLSETPNQFSKGWDAKYPRICTYGLFTSKVSKLQFWVINTHLDHIGVTAREKSVLLILKKIKEINTKGLPVIFMGDLNAEPESKVVKTLRTQLYTTKEKSIIKPLEPTGTFNNFEFNQPVTKRIDYIFISKNKNITVNKYAVLDDSKESKYPSDHLPVYAELSF